MRCSDLINLKARSTLQGVFQHNKELAVRNVMAFTEFKYLVPFLRYDNFYARLSVDVAMSD